jgi:hypothetical protein
MAQHLWYEFRHGRLCEVYRALQADFSGEWKPPVSPICAGESDDDGARGHRGGRPRSPAPSGAPRVLEMA